MTIGYRIEMWVFLSITTKAFEHLKVNQAAVYLSISILECLANLA